MKKIAAIILGICLVSTLNAATSSKKEDHANHKKPKTQTTVIKQNSDRVISGAENPDVNCIDLNGKTITKESPLYADCEREMKHAK